MTAEEIQAFLDRAAVGATVPYIVESATDHEVAVRLNVTPVLGRPGGTLSGPALMALADCAAWLATVAQIGPVALSVTTSLHIDFLRKPPMSDVVATARLVKLGSRLSVSTVSIASVETDDVVAHAQVTYSIPPPGSPERAVTI